MKLMIECMKTLHWRSTFNLKPKVLYVADSVGHTTSANQLEEFSNTRIRTARAYSSVFDKRARWPKQNFTDVVKNNLKNHGRQQYDVLVMSAPTVDISNLDTSKLQPTDNTEILQQNVVISAQNMFSLAQRSLEMNCNLKKVIIMEHSPRFDKPEDDPTSLKPTLAGLANFTLSQLWLNSPLKDKIFIGRHSLDSPAAGRGHEARYVNAKTGRYDGVHFYGPKGVRSYTQSVKNILSSAQLNSQVKPTAEGGTAQDKNYQAKFQNNYHPSVVTQNRFGIFNQGNC